MPWFKCFIHGENFVFDFDGNIQSGGFYTTRYVEAPNIEQAELTALENLRKDDLFYDEELKKRSPNAKVTFEEINELIDEPDEKDTSGYSFYTEDT